MKTIKELTKEELKELLKKNREFENYIYERAYEDNMFYQGERMKELMGDADGIEINNHYTSFYFRLKDAQKFFNSVNRNELDDEQRELYDNAKKLIDEYENLEADDLYGDKGEELYENIETECAKLMEKIEEELHGYETVTDDDFENYLDFILEDCDFETDGEKVYETITKVYK
jgi:hypothetical protein